MPVITPRSDEATELVRQFIIDMTPEAFSSAWDSGFEPIVGRRIPDLGEKPTPAVGDVFSYSTGLPSPEDTLKITIV